MMIISKMHHMLLSDVFKFRFDAPLIHSSVDFIKSWAVASILGFFVCMCCAAMKHCLANNVLGISSRIQLLFPSADAASMLFIGDTVISGICVAHALSIVAPRGSKNCISLTVIIIIMNWFQSAQGGGQPALQCVASGMIGFVAVHCLWNVEVKQLEWNINGTKLKTWLLNTANEDGDGGDSDGGEDGDRGDGDEGEDDASFASEDCGDDGGDGDGGDSDGGEDDASFASEDCGDEIGSVVRAVQLLAIHANFRISAINALDWKQYSNIYTVLEGEVQEEGMDLVLTGPYRMLEAYGALSLEVFVADDLEPCIFQEWDVTEPDDVEEFTRTIYGALGRKLEITYLVIPEAVETNVEVRLNLKDLGSGSRAVYGCVKARAIDYGSKWVHLFSCERGRSLSLPCGSTCIFPLTPFMIALPYRQHFKLHIEVDLRVMTTSDSQEEDNSLKFCLDCSRRISTEERLDFSPSRRIRSQKREVDGDQVEVDVIWQLECRI